MRGEEAAEKGGVGCGEEIKMLILRYIDTETSTQAKMKGLGENEERNKMKIIRR